MDAVAISSSSRARTDFARDTVGVELGTLGILQHNGRVELGQVDLPHGPATEVALGDFFVVQQLHLCMSRIADDLRVQLVHRRTAAFDGLQEDAAAVAQHTGDAVFGVVVAGAGQDGVDGSFVVFVDSAAHVKQSDQHGISLFGE
jgi:hypothetical protein